MANSEQAEQKKKRVNLAKVTEFFEAAGIPTECPICHTDNWNIPFAKTFGGNAIPWGSGDGGMFMMGLPVLVMVCAKCKFIRQHSLVEGDIPGALEDY